MKSGRKEIEQLEGEHTSLKYTIQKGDANCSWLTESDLEVYSAQHTLLIDRQSGGLVRVACELHVTGKIGLEGTNIEFNFDGMLDVTTRITFEGVE